MSEKRKSSRRAWLANVIIVGLIGLLAPVIVVMVVWGVTGQPPQFFTEQPPQIPPPDTQETVVVSVDAGRTPVKTENHYSGIITLVIEGSLPAEGAGLRDAFYRHAREMGIPLEEPVADASLLLVDGDPLSMTPSYDPFHVYTAAYDVGEAARPVTFALDESLIDTESVGRLRVFIIEIEPEFEASP